MYDWNHNGKKDMSDNYIVYQIYKYLRPFKEQPPSRPLDYKIELVKLNLFQPVYCIGMLPLMEMRMKFIEFVG